MATQIYMSIRGAVQGKFKGSSSKEGGIPVLNFSMGMSSPRDASTGQASGKRQHKPLKLSVPWGNWSPQIFSAMTTNEVLLTVALQVNGGSNRTCEVIKLTNATVTDLETHAGSSGLASQVQAVSFDYEKVSIGTVQHTTAVDDWELEKLAFSFQKIKLSAVGGKVSATDDWTM
ncbi:MAG TPA: type VI secretion system tube protein TssD [Bryobacteraceae bacterium]|nr:type VI secretion system tube protein TssD [Bryobacteraceae bacterium]